MLYMIIHIGEKVIAWKPSVSNLAMKKEYVQTAWIPHWYKVWQCQGRDALKEMKAQLPGYTLAV